MRSREVLVVIYVWRPFVLGWRILLEQFEHDLDSLFELWVVALAHEFRVHFDFVVGRDAVVFDLPLTLEVVDGEARRHDVSAVNELGIAADSDQTSPGLHSDQWAQAQAAEEPRQRVPTGACKLVDDHHFRAVDLLGGKRHVRAGGGSRRCSRRGTRRG